MGNCVSCTESSSHEQPDRWLTDGDKKIAESQTPGSLGAGGSGGMSGRNSEGMGGPGMGRDGFGNGSCTPGSTSTSHSLHHNQGHYLSPLDGVSSGSTNLSSSQKAEKKTFYSRIPPLGRSGSDKKASMISNSTSSTIKDNNNAYSETKIAAVFDLYKDPHEDLILAEGIEKLCKDLEVKPEDFKVLVLAWKFGAEQMCRFTREEFYRGMRELKTDNVKGIQARLPDCVAEVLSDPVLFKDLYRFAFRFGLDTELGQRILPMEMATSLWRVVFSQREPPLLDRWIFFLEAHPQIRGIPRDTWNMFLNFVETVDNDLSTYDDTEAWPSLFDDFVEFENDRLNQNLTSTINVVVSGEKSDQLQQHPMAIDDFTTTMMMATTIPPPAPFGDSSSNVTTGNGNISASIYNKIGSSNSSNRISNTTTSSSSLAKVLPVSQQHHHHHPQLMSIETSSTSGYTKIIHSSSPVLSPSTTIATSNNFACSNTATSIPGLVPPLPLAASSASTAIDAKASRNSGGSGVGVGIAEDLTTSPSPAPPYPFGDGYQQSRGHQHQELSDV